MSSLGNTIFLKMLENSQRQAEAARQNRVAQLEQQANSTQQLNQLFQNQLRMAESQFDRQLKLITTQAQLGGQMGRPQQVFENQQMQQAAEVGYIQGQAARGQQAQEAFLRERDFQLKAGNILADNERQANQAEWQRSEAEARRGDREIARQDRIDTRNLIAAVRADATTQRREADAIRVRTAASDDLIKKNVPNALRQIKGIEDIFAKYAADDGPAGIGSVANTARSGLEMAAEASPALAYFGPPGIAAAAAIKGVNLGADAAINSVLGEDAKRYNAYVAQLEAVYKNSLFGAALSAHENTSIADALGRAKSSDWRSRRIAIQEIKDIYETHMNTIISATNGLMSRADVEKMMETTPAKISVGADSIGQEMLSQTSKRVEDVSPPPTSPAMKQDFWKDPNLSTREKLQLMEQEYLRSRGGY